MEIVPSTFIALAAIGVLALVGPYKGFWAFMGLAPFGAAAAFNLPAVGGATIGMLEFTICAVFLLAALRPDGPNNLMGTLRPGQAGFWLLLLMAYCVLSAAFFPRVLSGQTEIFSLSRSVNSDGIVSIPLRPSSGNITQTFYMLLSALCFLSVATLFRVKPAASAVVAALAVTTSANFVLGWLDVLTYRLGLEVLLEPIRTANYDITIYATMAGIKRMIGGWTEASAYGAFSLALLGFWLHFWIVAPRSRLASVMLALATISVLRSTSSGAYVALLLFLTTYACGWVFRAARGRFSQKVAALLVTAATGLWVGVVGVLVGYELVPQVRSFLDETLLTKLSSDSGVERMSWNVQALQNFWDTYGLGAGMGSVRASNWFVACLGSLGVIGTGLMLLFLGKVATAPSSCSDKLRCRVIQALKISCLAQVLAALPTAPTPNLGTTFFICAGLIVGLSRSIAVSKRQVPVRLPVRQGLPA